jgi:F0F1-type ATP synthase assembly protein I
MDYVLFARFTDRTAAGQCLRDVHATVGKGLTATVHWGASDSASFDQIVQHSADFTQTDRRHALVVGIATGTVVGAVLGVVLVSIGLFPSTLPQGALFGALMGLALGLLAMLILGAGLMDRRLRRLTAGLHRGEVVVTMHLPGREAADRATTVLVAHGAAFAEKSSA